MRKIERSFAEIISKILVILEAVKNCISLDFSSGLKEANFCCLCRSRLRLMFTINFYTSRQLIENSITFRCGSISTLVQVSSYKYDNK